MKKTKFRDLLSRGLLHSWKNPKIIALLLFSLSLPSCVYFAKVHQSQRVYIVGRYGNGLFETCSLSFYSSATADSIQRVKEGVHISKKEKHQRAQKILAYTARALYRTIKSARALKSKREEKKWGFLLRPRRLPVSIKYYYRLLSKTIIESPYLTLSLSLLTWQCDVRGE